MIAESQIASSIHLHPQERNQPLGNQSKASGLSALGSILMIPQLSTIFDIMVVQPRKEHGTQKIGSGRFRFPIGYCHFWGSSFRVEIGG